jgi:hypothetical protein
MNPMKTCPPPVPRAIALCLFLSPATLLGDGSDDFNDNSKDSSKWGPTASEGNGALAEAGQKLRYTCGTGTIGDDANWPWNATRFPYNADWEMRIDCHNSSNPVAPAQINSMGFTLESPLSANTFVYHEFYNSAFGVGSTQRTGFNADMTVGGASVGGEDSGEQFITDGALRLRWNSATRVLTCEHDTNPADGYQWILLATFGLDGAGGTHNADWGMADGDQFFMSVYGYSTLMSVPAGQMTLDNFNETGGVAPGGGVRPEPVGSFPFVFNTGNPLLTRIASITGNYKGVTPTAAARNFDLDIAQDESGKLVALGTVDGIADASGAPDVGGSVGAVKTVNGEPVAQIKGSFKGSRDGESASVSGTLSGPVEVDGSGAVPAIGGTGSYQSKVAGVPFSGKNVPVRIDAPEGTDEGLKQDWSLQLVLAAKTIGGKEKIVASATLVLPDGDTLVFPEKAVKYSPAKGYKLTFKKGTNTTANPDKIDPKTTILLSGLKFAKTGDAWVPDAGTITYQFLGQKGVANLMEFIAP